VPRAPSVGAPVAPGAPTDGFVTPSPGRVSPVPHRSPTDRLTVPRCPVMVAPSSTRELLEIIRKSGIYPAERLSDQLRGSPDLPEDAVRAAVVLVRRGLLTQFQAKMLLAGRCNGFKLGPYVIREQIGQGGMGIVYQAEHEDLRRRVAVKVLIPPK